MSETASTLTTEKAPSRWRVVLALVWLLGFSTVFFQLTFPNHPEFSRLDIWAELPILLLNTVAQPDDAPESTWANLPQRFPFLLAASAALFGAWGLGQFVLRLLRVPLAAGSLERFVLGSGVGLSGISLLVLGLGLLAQVVPGAMSRPVLLSCLLLFGIAETVSVFRNRRARRDGDSVGTTENEAADPKPAKPSRRKPNSTERGMLDGGQISFGQLGRFAAGVTIVLFVVAIALGSMLPSIDFDVKEYHLGGPKEHFQNGFISFLPHNVYTSFPFLTEMLSLLGMILCDDWSEGALAGKLILASFGPLTSLAVFAAARRWFGELAAWVAMLIHISTPWTYRISVIAYAEGGLTFFLFAALLAMLLAMSRVPDADESETESSRPQAGPCRSMVLLCGLLAGSAMACKYPGVLQVVIPLGVILLWLVFRTASHQPAQQVLKTGLVYSAGVLLAVGPWLLKNLCETGNPLYPLLQSVFAGIDWTPTLEANWQRGHSPSGHDPVDFFIKLFDVTLKSDWLSPLLFSLAPLAWLNSKSRGVVRGLSCYVAFLFLSWWIFTHRIDRFWIPMIPVVALLAGAGVAWSRDRVWQWGALSVVSLCVLFNLAFITTPLCGLNRWLGDIPAVRDVAAQASCPGIASMNRMLDHSKVKVLMVGEAQIFDARFPLIYNTVFDISIFEQWCSAAKPETAPADQPMKPPDEIRQKLLDENVTHIYVNWQEVLRYRMTYGYSEFVAPHRFQDLVGQGIVYNPLVITGSVELNSMGEREQADIRQWAPELIRKTDGEEVFISSQLFTVRR